MLNASLFEYYLQQHYVYYVKQENLMEQGEFFAPFRVGYPERFLAYKE